MVVAGSGHSRLSSCQGQEPFGQFLNPSPFHPFSHSPVISSRNTCRCNALRLSACEARRLGSSHGQRLRSTTTSSEHSHAHASTVVYCHEHRWNAPTLANRSRTCCCPAPQTSLTSLKLCSWLLRSAASRISSTVASGLVLSQRQPEILFPDQHHSDQPATSPGRF
jgi:hypothetical protein